MAAAAGQAGAGGDAYGGIPRTDPSGVGDGADGATGDATGDAHAHARGAGAAGEGGLHGAADPPPVEAPERPAIAFLRDVESVVSAFFVSLLPSWRPYEPGFEENFGANARADF